MSPTPSNFAVDTRYDGFLHALIGSEANRMPISVLSALARSDVDPWAEAAQLSAMSKESAKRRLVVLIGPILRNADMASVTDRLIRLLPTAGAMKAVPMQTAPTLFGLTHLSIGKLLIAAAMAATLISALTHSDSSSRSSGQPNSAITDRVPQGQ